MRPPLSIRFEAPFDRIINKLETAGFSKGTKPIPKFVLMFNTKDQIIHIHNSVIRGILNYYSFVHNYGKLVGLINNIIKGSCTMLLAAKFNLKSQSAVYDKYGKNLQGNDKVAFVKVSYKMNP
jgi:Type II intron maturase